MQGSLFNVEKIVYLILRKHPYSQLPISTLIWQIPGYFNSAITWLKPQKNGMRLFYFSDLQADSTVIAEMTECRLETIPFTYFVADSD